MEFETSYRTKTSTGSVERVTEVMEVSNDEVHDLLEIALAGNLDGVDRHTIQSELERREE